MCIKRRKNNTLAPLEPIILENLFERVQIDLIDYSKSPDDLYKYIIYIKDYFNKFLVAKATFDKEASTVTKIFNDY